MHCEREPLIRSKACLLHFQLVDWGENIPVVPSSEVVVQDPSRRTPLETRPAP